MVLVRRYDTCIFNLCSNGSVIAVSYEARAFGIKRGIMAQQVGGRGGGSWLSRWEGGEGDHGPAGWRWFHMGKGGGNEVHFL